MPGIFLVVALFIRNLPNSNRHEQENLEVVDYYCRRHLPGSNLDPIVELGNGDARVLI
jgi:hypothetical protein